MAAKIKKADIPRYELGDFRHVHRVPGEGLVGSVGPLRPAFYRLSITVSGEKDFWTSFYLWRNCRKSFLF